MVKRVATSMLVPLALALSNVSPVHAQSYPAQPITMVVSFAPGGATDIVARAMAHEMSQDLKQTVVVVNRAGAGGSIGTGAIASAHPNGYTIGLISVASLTILPHMQAVPYNFASFDYLCRAYDIPVFVLVTPDSRFKTLKDLVDYARDNPNKLNYATVGPGSLPNMAALDLSRAANIRMNHIPYKGEGPAVTDLLGKHVDVYFGTNAVATSHNLRRLGVASEARNEESPDTPTLAEAGYKVVWSIMGGMLAPKGLDPNIRATLQKSCAKASNTPAYKTALENLKVRPLYADGANFQKLLVAESTINHQLLKSAGLLAKSSASAANPQ